MSYKKSFKNYGLVRTENFNDIKNKKTALTNILNDLVSGDLSFDADDIAPINDLYVEKMTNSDFIKIAGSTVQKSDFNSITNLITESPFITLKNRINILERTTGKESFFNGGNGLPAKFWSADKLLNLSEIDDGDSVSLENPDTVLNLLWDNGYFNFSNVIDNTLGGSNGAIQWEGYFTPVESGVVDFSFNTTGYFIFEVENNEGILEVAKKVTNEYTAISLNEVSSGNLIEISKLDYINIPENVSVTINGVNTLVENVYDSGDSTKFYISLRDNVSILADEPFTISVDNYIGEEGYRVQHAYRNLEKFVSKKIRITLIFPEIGENYLRKYLDVDFRHNFNSFGQLYFWYLSKTPTYDNEVEKSTFKSFFNNTLLGGGGTIGPESVESSNEYIKLLTTSPLFVGYIPPKAYSDILVGDYQYRTVSNSKVISVTENSPLTDGIEIGNIIYNDNISKNSRVVEISSNILIISDNDSIGSSSTESVKFFSHKGYINNKSYTLNNNVVTIDDNAFLKVGMVCVTENTTRYCRVQEILSNSQFTVDDNLELSQSGQMFFYQDKGLTNNTLDNFCSGVIGKETAGGLGEVVSVGDTDIILNNVSDLVLDMVVQSTGSFDEGTTITSINNATNTITISNPAIGSMISGISIVFCPPSTTLNKEQCIIPLNTAPPFSGTDTGLATNKNIELSHPNSNLSVISLTANLTTVNAITQNNQTYDREIGITVKGNRFNIISSSS
jgi:hypothetical protein